MKSSALPDESAGRKKKKTTLTPRGTEYTSNDTNTTEVSVKFPNGKVKGETSNPPKLSKAEHVGKKKSKKKRDTAGGEGDDGTFSSVESHTSPTGNKTKSKKREKNRENDAKGAKKLKIANTTVTDNDISEGSVKVSEGKTHGVTDGSDVTCEKDLDACSMKRASSGSLKDSGTVPKTKLRRNKKGKKRNGGGDTVVEKSKKALESLLSEDKRIVQEQGKAEQEGVSTNDAEVLFATEHWDKADPPIEGDGVGGMESGVKIVKKKKKQKIKEENVATTEKDKESAKKQALSYLRLWKKNRENWSFKKVRQIWLMKHMYDPDVIKNRKFEVLMEYLSGAQGAARKHLVEKAEAIFAAVDQTEPCDGEKEQQKPSAVIVERARQVLQMLSD